MIYRVLWKLAHCYFADVKVLQLFGQVKIPFIQK